MHSTHLLPLAALTAANLNPKPNAPPAAPASALITPPARFQPRQAGSSNPWFSGLQESNSCAFQYASIMRDIPALEDEALFSWGESALQPTTTISPTGRGSDGVLELLSTYCEGADRVATLTPPASLASAFSSYSSEFIDWGSEMKSDVSRISAM